MALAVGHVIAKHPVETMRPGDVFIHNDPWIGTGHTNDFSVTTPCFRGGAFVGILACNCHLMDIGGMRNMVGTRDVFEEGLFIPILKIVDAGVVNETLMAIIRANTRLPVENEGDTYALISCNEVGCERLIEMMDQFALADLDDLSDHIIDASRDAVLARIRELPRGTWHYTLTLDGQDNEAVELRAALTVSDDGIDVDYTGSSPMVRHNFNVPICYTLAYTSYALGCIVARDIPNNAGSLEPRRVEAELGSIVHALKPAAVVSRHLIGLMLPDLVFGCLRQAIPDRVPAEGAGRAVEHQRLRPAAQPGGDRRRFPRQHRHHRRHGRAADAGRPVRDRFPQRRPRRAGRDLRIDVHFGVLAQAVSARVRRRRRTRGGLGQDIEIGNSLDEPFQCTTFYRARGLPGARASTADCPARRAMSGWPRATACPARAATHPDGRADRHPVTRWRRIGSPAGARAGPRPAGPGTRTDFGRHRPRHIRLGPGRLRKTGCQ